MVTNFIGGENSCSSRQYRVRACMQKQLVRRLFPPGKKSMQLLYRLSGKYLLDGRQTNLVKIIGN